MTFIMMMFVVSRPAATNSIRIFQLSCGPRWRTRRSLIESSHSDSMVMAVNRTVPCLTAFAGGFPFWRHMIAPPTKIQIGLVTDTKGSKSSSLCPWSAPLPANQPPWTQGFWIFASIRQQWPHGVDMQSVVVHCCLDEVGVYVILRITVLNVTYARGGARDLMLEYVAWSMNCLSILTVVMFQPFRKHI